MKVINQGTSIVGEQKVMSCCWPPGTEMRSWGGPEEEKAT